MSSDDAPAAPRPPVVNIADVLADPALVDDRARRGVFQAKVGMIGRALGSKGVGINVTVVPPRSKAFPRHYHYVNDELFVVLEGTGVLHHGEDDHPLKPGDVVLIEAGTGIPFQIENDSDAELRYLGLSTLIPGDVFHYVDSGKHGVMAGRAPFSAALGEGLAPFVRFFDETGPKGYYDGEPEAE